MSGAPGSVEPFAQITITNPRTGESVKVTAESDGSFSAVIAAETGDVLHIEAADPAGNHGEYRPFPVRGDLPPDPATIAPPLVETEVTPMHEATAFLYSGANPIQTGVAEDDRAAPGGGHPREGAEPRQPAALGGDDYRQGSPGARSDDEPGRWDVRYSRQRRRTPDGDL